MVSKNLWTQSQVSRISVRTFKLYGLNADQLSQELPSLDSIDMAYQDFCNAIYAAAKLPIPPGRRNNYRPCWDAECEHLNQIFLRASHSKATSLAASTLLSHLDEKRKDRWFEAVNNIDFTHSSRLA